MVKSHRSLRFNRRAPPTKLEDLRAYKADFPTAYFYAMRGMLPPGEVARAARLQLDKRYAWSKLPANTKPTVRVFQLGGKEWFALRVGKWVVSAHSWGQLTKKVAFGPWRQFNDTQILRERWRA